MLTVSYRVKHVHTPRRTRSHCCSHYFLFGLGVPSPHKNVTTGMLIVKYYQDNILRRGCARTSTSHFWLTVVRLSSLPSLVQAWTPRTEFNNCSAQLLYVYVISSSPVPLLLVFYAPCSLIYTCLGSDMSIPIEQGSNIPMMNYSFSNSPSPFSMAKSHEDSRSVDSVSPIPTNRQTQNRESNTPAYGNGVAATGPDQPGGMGLAPEDEFLLNEADVHAKAVAKPMRLGSLTVMCLIFNRMIGELSRVFREAKQAH